MTLRHPGTTDEHLAFKVKTTQPRRYLVRPNQGLVSPGGVETISILLVEKEKQSLLQSYDRLGQSALDHSKDKFLVQSCAVSQEFAKKYLEEKKKSNANSKELSDALTSVWNAVSSGGASQIYNKKLHVRHVVPEGSSAPTSSAAKSIPKMEHETPLSAIENMTPEQMFSEISNLRRKYDELVSFSVNLTAERDILNNTLEQTKRDLNREMAARAALENKGYGSRSKGSGGQAKGSLMGFLLPLLVTALACFLMGVRLSQQDQVGFLEGMPVVGDFVFAEASEETSGGTTGEEM